MYVNVSQYLSGIDEIDKNKEGPGSTKRLINSYSGTGRAHYYGVAGELLLPMRVVGALITFLTYLTYLVTFVFGGVVTMLLHAGSSRKRKSTKRNEGQSKRLGLPKDSLIRPTGKIRTKCSNPGKEVVSYRTPQECGDMIEYYLQHDEETWHGSRA